MRVHQQSAYVLLNRPYSESSWIVEIYSKDYGRLALMAKGARRIKSKLKGVLLPFQPLLLSWVGKGDIPTLTSAEIQVEEINMIDHEMKGDQLVCGFYCNELILYLLHRHDPHQRLFDRYHQTMMGLYDPKSVINELSLANTLRDFEQMMIKETGYGISFHYEFDSKTSIRSECFYQFQYGQGFIKSNQNYQRAISGQTIIALQDDNKKQLNEYDMSLGKHLMRDILSQTLGYKKINSRDLFYPKHQQ